MIFEWDETKREINRGKHKLDPIDGQYLFDDRPVVTYPSPRVDEARFVTVGWLAANSMLSCGPSAVARYG